MGGVEGYLLLIAIIYAGFSKRLAVEASVILLLSMVANHLLKTFIQNPRPFVADGTFLDNWAVSSGRAQELVAEFSTPSGHAMAAATFFGFLAGRADPKSTKFIAILAAFLIGISRPILGVHYIEDILLGWCIGAVLAYWAVSHIDNAWKRWCQVALRLKLLLILGLSAAVWGTTLLVTQRSIAVQPIEFVSVLGFLSGVAIAVPIEERSIAFLGGDGALGARLARCVLMIAILAGAYVSLSIIMDQMVSANAMTATLTRYVGFAALAAVGMLAAPWLFTRFKLAG